MRPWISNLLAFLVIAAIGHAAVLFSAPGLIMDRVMERMEAGGVELHAFTLAPRMTPQTQTVVRPSPDLAYSICRFDFSEDARPLNVQMAAYPGYSSLSFFDARTNNFARFRGDGESVNVLLMPPGSVADDPDQVAAPSARGLILIRRLAPRLEDYGAVYALSSGDGCAPDTSGA